MREKDLWMFSIPDVFGRVVLTGVTAQAPDVSDMVVKATRNGSHKGYSVPILSANAEIHTVNYYDDYSFVSNLSAYGATLNDTDYEENPDYGSWYATSQKGLLTGTLTAQFTDEGISNEYLCTVMYYDERGRVVQTKSNNHLGGMEKEYIAYNFTGQPKKRMLVHSGNEDITQVYDYDYDHAGRLKFVKHSVNGNPSVTLAANDYDELGRIEKTIQGDNANLDNNYRYNVRSWIETKSGYQFNTALEYGLTGNISSMEWEEDNKLREYTYDYDGLSRLLSASFTENADGEKYSTNYKYDKHGNILSLRREGKADTCYATIDSLAIRYQGNQMTRVTDNGMCVNLPESNAFEQGSTKSTQYSYNKNGAMTMDLNKKITDISYNVLNLPNRLVIDSITHTYTYAADGRKLRVQQGEDKRDYAGSIIYEDSSLKRILVDGGYAQKEGDSWKYYFYFNDHLGNNTVLVDQDGNVVQNNSYYPFGLPMATASDSIQGLQSYKYNGKEFERKDGLRLYDYGARHYDAQVGRFVTMDPMTEKYYAVSPYAYCANNPIKSIDPDGKENIVVVGSQNDNSAGNKLMFVNQAIRSLRLYSKSHPNESRSMVLFTGGYTKKQIARIEKSVAKYGGTLIQVNSAKEMTNYINSKSTGNSDLSTARTEDKITNMDMFSHGIAGAVEFGYKTENAESYSLNKANVMNINKGAFYGTASTITSYACRTALGTDIRIIGSDYGINPVNSFAQKLANASGAHVQAFPVRTDYQFTLGTWSERRFGFPNPKPIIETVDGAAFMPMGASHSVKPGNTPIGLYQGHLNFYPR